MLEILKKYLRGEDYYIILYSNFVYIYNYLDIIKFTDTSICLKLKNLKINITGNDLLITKLEPKEIMIKGIINDLEKIYE